jgi:hypothetical protein
MPSVRCLSKEPQQSMKTFKHILPGTLARSALVIISVPLFIQTFSLFGFPLSPLTPQTNSDQQPVTIKNDEFSIVMPVQPSVHVEPTTPYQFEGGVVKYQVETGAYKEGIVFLVEVYDNSNPGSFQRKYRQWPTASRRWRNAATSEITLKGVNAQQYIVKTDDFYLISQAFNSKRRS